ncbi:MAG: hypothetical protein ACOX5A_01360 [Aminivibrio sp.]|jgi:hypothetical protein
MIIPLEGQDAVSATRIVAMVRSGDKTFLYFRDGTTATTGFRPETLRKRYNAFCKEARDNARALCGRMGGNRE